CRFPLSLPGQIPPYVERREQVEMRSAAVLEQGHVPPQAFKSITSRAEIEEIGFDLVAGDDPAFERIAEIARLVDGEPARIDKKPRSYHCLVITFAHIG